jgi:hypothetical protein
MNRIFLALVLLMVITSGLISQEKKPVTLNGYVTAMQSVMFDSLKGTFTNESLIHNRLNFRGYFNDNITFGLELRNRIFTGDMVESNTGYADYIASDPGLTDLSWNIVNESSLIVNSTIDRYWLDFNYGKIQARIGRQRINWGQTLVWNPNDIFNAYSIFDFDYIERPGSDAIRLQYYPHSASAIEAAVKANSNNEITAAALYRFNNWSYDIQFLAGYFNGEDYVAGTGWSGAIGSISFRGEATWFQSVRHFSDSTGNGLFTIGLDKSFKNNSLAQIQIMYCNDPVNFTSFGSFYKGNLSAKDLAFSKFSAFGQFSYQITPLLNTGISGMWLPDLSGYFAGATFDYSLSENIDFSLIWQHFTSEMNSVKSDVNMCFLRIKCSF